jgi:hypothetical protein
MPMIVVLIASVDLPSVGQLLAAVPVIGAMAALLNVWVSTRNERRTAAGAQYAVVLLTADEEARPRGTDSWELRARPNVSFELGFFFGKLGRALVAVLYESGVEKPSDIDGLVYIGLDEAGAWKIELYREMRAAGLDADLNRLAPS